MKITTGLFDHMVLQRTDRNKSAAQFTGMCDACGPVQARVTQDGHTLIGWDGVTIGEASQGFITGCLCGIPCGGPYAIELWIAVDGRNTERLDVHDILVGDVWILAGQSNMQGCGARTERATPHPLVRAFYMDDRWEMAEDPIHNLHACVDQVHIDLNGGQRLTPAYARGVGPGVAFGIEMYVRSGIPQGLIACAHGGSSLAQWIPTPRRCVGSSLYGAMLRRVRKNGGRIAGVIWYQGCSDANPVSAAQYTKGVRALVHAMRRDFADRTLPFLVVQIARYAGPPNDYPSWNVIQEQQRNFPKQIKRCTLVPTVDLDLDDRIHISGSAQNRLGKRMAYAMHTLCCGTEAGLPPITLKRIFTRGNCVNGYTDVIVEFGQVVGQLIAPGRPHGFAIVDETEVSYIYRIDLRGNQAILHTPLSPSELATKSLHYGFGHAPYCNITDEADRSLPVFGPVAIRDPRASIAYIRQLLVSSCYPLDGSLKSLTYPISVSWQCHDFGSDFCDMHDALAEKPDSVIFYCCRIECASSMKLAACLGYDGPVKVWIDGVAKFLDLQATNPAVYDQATIRFKVTAGKHEIVIALDSHQGHACGIFLRIGRTDGSTATAGECRSFTIISEDTSFALTATE